MSPKYLVGTSIHCSERHSRQVYRTDILIASAQIEIRAIGFISAFMFAGALSRTRNSPSLRGLLRIPYEPFTTDFGTARRTELGRVR